MSKLTDHLANILPSSWRDKKYEKERGKEIATCFLIKNALKTGAYLSEELEYQSQDEHIQFRANKEHPVILGDMLNRIFDIMKKIFVLCMLSMCGVADRL